MSYRERNGLGYDYAATNDALKRLDTRRQERAARLLDGSEQKARRWRRLTLSPAYRRAMGEGLAEPRVKARFVAIIGRAAAETDFVPTNTSYAEQQRAGEAATDLAEKAADREAAAESAPILILDSPVPVGIPITTHGDTRLCNAIGG
jgi:hypothetical protein